MINPLYKDGEEDQAGSMTDDEKMAYQEAVRKMMNSEHQVLFISYKFVKGFLAKTFLLSLTAS